MSIFQLDTAYISEKLIPPSLRGVIHLAWMRVVLKPLQSFIEYVFNDYKLGSTYLNYNSAVAYLKWDRVIYSDRKVYLCIADAAAGIMCSDTTHWVKINDDFIGADEKVKYNSQKMLFEYALNKWFQIPSGNPQIYITNNSIITSAFVMGSTSAYSSAMANNSVHSTSWMGSSYSVPGGYDFTIYVPNAVFIAQGSTTANRENAIRFFADKYNLIGMIYNVTPY